MIIRFFLVLLISLPSAVFAMEELSPEESTNHCLDKESAAGNEALAKKYPEDEKVVMLVALRAGLCDLIDKGIIELDFGIDLFKEIKASSMLERFQENRQEELEDEDRSFEI